FPLKQDLLLREWLRHEGLKDLVVGPTGFPPCAKCQLEDGILACMTCHSSGFLCAPCFRDKHQAQPLHRCRIWNGKFLSPYSLERAGLIVQLGHDGDACDHPELKNSLLTVIDTNGIHRVRYATCGCLIPGRSDVVVQLMRARWWPASMFKPRIAVTFAVLELYQALSIQGKVNSYDFYNGIVRLTDGGGVVAVKTCYKSWTRCGRMFRHLRRAKRAGRGHDAMGVGHTKQGELVVECPACPIVEKNLPEGFADAPPEMQFLYVLLLAIDANFKLKLKQKNTNSDAVVLCDGLGYFPPSGPYNKHLNDHDANQPQDRHCTSEHNALRHANSIPSKRWAVNGVGAAVCARHLLYRAHGIVDLPKGEKHLSMDYCIFGMLGRTAKTLRKIVFSYDIVCSWSVHFFQRLEDLYGDIYKLPDDHEFTFVVPKFHLEAHGEDCKCAFNLNYTKGVARTCGEGIEAGWADMNLIGVFTREMSAGHRHEIIEDFMSAINFRKIKTMDRWFLQQLTEAVKMKAKMGRDFEDHQATLPAARVKLWEEEIRKWDALTDKKGKGSPYREPVYTQSLKTVKSALKNEEEEELKREVPLNEMTAATYVSSVIALEDQMCVFIKSKRAVKTEQDEASLAIKQNQLFQRMQALESLERLPTPKGRNKKKRTTTGPSSVLWLPSNIPSSLHRSMLFSNLALKEIRIRLAICLDALHDICRILRTRHALYLTTRKHGHVSQRYQTRHRSSLNSIRDALKRHTGRYRRSYAALVALDPDGEFENGAWLKLLRPLEKEDLRAPADNEAVAEEEVDEVPAQSSKRPSEGRRTMTWIWKVGRVEKRDQPATTQGASDDEIFKFSKIDWARARARAMRWDEQETLLLEEMRRVMTTHLFTANVWTQRALNVRTEFPFLLGDLASGLEAYAYRQANVYESLALNCVRKWAPFVRKHSLALEWPKAL
ncbi:hypothetical protein PENSPDRAFT_540919, partial [Peniophora sp. CONT]